MVMFICVSFYFSFIGADAIRLGVVWMRRHMGVGIQARERTRSLSLSSAPPPSKSEVAEGRLSLLSNLAQSMSEEVPMDMPLTRPVPG